MKSLILWLGRCLAAIWDWLLYGLREFKRTITPHSLLTRFLLIILMPLLILQAIIMLVFFDRHWDTVGRRLARDVVGELELTADMLQNPNLPPDQVDALLATVTENLGLEVSFIPGAHLDTLSSPKSNMPIKALLDELNAQNYPFTVHTAPDQQTELSLQLKNGVLQSTLPRKRFFSSTVYVFLAWLFGFSALLFGIAFLFMKNQVRSIQRLSRAAELFGRGQSVAHFKPEGATEVRQAGRSFLEMRNRIQRYLTERTGMLSGVSHDLRTPLTRMKLQLSMAPQTDAVRDLLSDVSEMEHMLSAYLSFARGEGRETPEETDLNALLDSIVAKLTRAGQDIDFHQEASLTCVCRPTDLSRALTNLLTNAGRYAKSARLMLGRSHQFARIVLDDDGPGIPQEKRADVFRAFYRMESSRNLHTGGVGLGLTIARDIILSHGGDIDLTDSPLGGLRVIVLLPLDAPTRPRN